MNRPTPQQQRPLRDHIRVTPGTRNAAASLPREQEFDDPKLMTLLQSASKDMQGLRLVHLHLSQLDNTELSDTAVINRMLGEVSANAAHLQMFNMSNGDIIMLYKGLKFSAVEEVCKKIEAQLLAKTKMNGPNPYRENSTYSILELSMNFVHVIRWLESITKTDASGGALAPGVEAKPAIGPEELGKIDKALKMFDLSPFLFNQAIVNIRDDSDKNKEYFELYITIKGLQARLSPDFDLSANRWLFNYFTSSLDQSLLRSLNHGLEFMGNESIGININLSTAMGPAFQKFDERLPAAFRGKVVLEINKGDLMENLQLYRELLAFAADREYRLCIDGLNDFWVTQFDLEALGCDYAKVFWSNDLLALEGDRERAFLEKVDISRNGRCKFILARCSTVTGLLYANNHGVDLVQGQAVDAVMRKGIRITEAIKTAMMMDD
jgi:EAL domain-containing protein (putative c-di-GMP-specific phosphodiesterase class I)